MRAVVFERKLMRTYFLGYYYYRFMSFLPKQIKIESNENEAGDVVYKDNFVSWEEVFETEDYIREFSENEYLNIKGENYKIENVSHAEDGTIFYRIDKNIIVVDEESKIKAESDLESRKKILEERKKGQENKKCCVEEENKINNIDKENLIPTKKWYEVWK